MNTQIDMNTFNEMLKNESAEGSIIFALKKLAEISEPKSITEAKGPQPLGVWSDGPCKELLSDDAGECPRVDPNMSLPKLNTS